MALEDLIPEDIDCVYAAKLMAPHLEATYKQPSELGDSIWYAMNHLPTVCLAGIIYGSAWLAEHASLLASPKKRKERKREKAEEQAFWQKANDGLNEKENEIMQKLSDAGVHMPQGRLAFSFAQRLSTHLGFLLEYWQGSDSEKIGVEFLDFNHESRLHVSEIRLPKESFERMLDTRISDTMDWMGEQGYRINPDFNEKAKAFLLQETYSRLEQGKRFNLLEAVDIGMDEQQRVYLRRL